MNSRSIYFCLVQVMFTRKAEIRRMFFFQLEFRICVFMFWMDCDNKIFGGNVLFKIDRGVGKLKWIA